MELIQSRIAVPRLIGDIQELVVTLQHIRIDKYDLGVAVFEGQHQLPVGGLQETSVAAHVVGAEAVFFPQAQGVYGVDHMGGAQKEHVQVAVAALLHKAVVFDIGILARGDPVRHKYAGERQGGCQDIRKDHSDGFNKPVHINLTTTCAAYRQNCA